MFQVKVLVPSDEILIVEPMLPVVGIKDNCFPLSFLYLVFKSSILKRLLLYKRII